MTLDKIIEEAIIEAEGNLESQRYWLNLEGGNFDKKEYQEGVTAYEYFIKQLKKIKQPKH